MHGHEPCDCDYCKMYDARQRQIAEATPRLNAEAYEQSIAFAKAQSKAEAEITTPPPPLTVAVYEARIQHALQSRDLNVAACNNWRAACAAAEADVVNVRASLTAVIDAFGLRKSYCSGIAADVLREALRLLEGGR